MDGPSTTYLRLTDSAGLFIGTGIGLRYSYSTPIGPCGDVGVPFERRSGVDDIVQIYVSIEQAF